jgi:2-polyprenyl-6-methoxyphenol hydroxylase-like FAD-dependent oxidoreductase
MPDCWRIILRVPAEVPEHEAMDDAWILARLQAVLPSWRHLPGVVGKDIYGVSRRMASRYRQGHAYLMGDAAHITNTRGGMNMNCGIHDAAALASAIVRALNDGNPGLVDDASDERFRIATTMLLPRTERSGSGGKAWTDTLRDTAAKKDAARAYLRTAAMMDMLDRSDAHA